VSHLPEDSDERNGIPMADGLLYYFPAALAEVAKVSRIGNDKHNPGQPMHWAREKSTDHANKIMRHLVDAGSRDKDGVRHAAYLAWRALALLQIECERDGAPMAPNARSPGVRQPIDLSILTAGEFTEQRVGDVVFRAEIPPATLVDHSILGTWPFNQRGTAYKGSPSPMPNFPCSCTGDGS